MPSPSIFFIGTHCEVEHHAAPLQRRLENVFVVTPEEALERACPADLAIFFSEHFDRFRNTCVELKKRGVATLYLIDGIIEWRNAWENRPDEPACPWTMRPVLSHKVACIGNSQARILDSWGNGSKIEIIGIPRLDALATARAPKENNHKESPFRLLVMTAKWPGFTDQQVERTVRGLKDLKQAIESWSQSNNCNVKVTWRLTQGIEQKVGVKNSLNDLCGMDLADAIESADAVITTPSTALLEAMLLDRPAAILEYNNTPQYVPAAWKITAKEQIEDTLSQLFAPAERRMLLQKSILKDALACDGKASDRLEKLALDMLAIANEQTNSNQPLSFPTNMVEASETNSVEFSHPRLYTSQEFSQTDTLELQSHLAQSRREITHLQSIIDQLQSELDEAHAIFDQIHEHPIAGPIVRVRQRLVDWLQRFKNRSSSNEKSNQRGVEPSTQDPLAATPHTETHS